MQDAIKCIKCDEVLVLKDIEWKIGIYKDMKSKEIVCSKGHFNRFSINVKDRVPKIANAFLKGIK